MSLPVHIPMHWGSLDQASVFVLLSYFDTASIVLCMCGFLFLIYKQKQFEEDADILDTSPGDYTILVEGLPDDVCAQELAEYFEAVLSHEDAGVFNTQDIAEGHHKVADCVVHRAYGSVLSRSLEIAAVEKELVVAETDSANPSQKTIKAINAKLEKLHEVQVSRGSR